MKFLLQQSLYVLFFILTTVTVVAAASKPAEQGGSLLLSLFIGFFSLIIVFQLVPACLLFVGMVKGLWKQEQGSSVEKVSEIL
jgi:hypothetical protein